MEKEKFWSNIMTKYSVDQSGNPSEGSSAFLSSSFKVNVLSRTAILQCKFPDAKLNTVECVLVQIFMNVYVCICMYISVHFL